MNYLRTAALLAALTGLFLVVGYLVGGQGGMLLAFLFALATNAFAYWNSDRMVLSMYGAEEVDRATAPALHDLVAELAQRAALPMPRVYVIHSPQPNAFATGRDPAHAAVAATTGLLDTLSREEVAGVLAHELAHVRNRDTLIMTITATIAGAIGMLANFAFFFGGSRSDDEQGGSPLGFIGVILAAILAPFVAMLVQAAVSRSREYAADAEGAAICGRPLWLASALERIERGAAAAPLGVAERNPATAHLFIVNPLHGRSFQSLFATHPDTSDRVARLRALAGAVPTARPAYAHRRGPWG